MGEEVRDQELLQSERRSWAYLGKKVVDMRFVVKWVRHVRLVTESVMVMLRGITASY